MRNKLFTREIHTGNMTLSSNVTSVTAQATRISRVEEIPGDEQANPSAIYLDLTVEKPVNLHDVLEATEEVDLTLNLDDAVELGLLLTAMGMEHKTEAEISKIKARLDELINEYK